MEFGYFTLSDNHYQDSSRTANQYVKDITAEAVYAESLGMHSAWIGEHHFNSLGVLSCPDIVLSYVAARTEKIRLAPAVTVLPIHHPIRVAEQWATLDLLSNGRVDFATGRGYDKREYAPLNANFENNLEIFEEGLEIVHKLWNSDDKIDHLGKHYNFKDIKITPQPIQKPLPTYIASFSAPSIELAGRLGCGLIVAPFAAAMTFGGLQKVNDLYQEEAAKKNKENGRLMCSYFIHFADDEPSQTKARNRMIRYYQECVIPALPHDPKKTPPSYEYFINMVKKLKEVKPEELKENSVLIGNSQHIIDVLKKVEAAGVKEVILYFNVGQKPHQQVKEEMARFMEEVAPAFEGKHLLSKTAA